MNNNSPKVKAAVEALKSYALKNNKKVKFYGRVANTGEFAIFMYEGDEPCSSATICGEWACPSYSERNFSTCIQAAYRWIDNNKK